MKLDCVLTAVNELPKYLGFVPIFIKFWNTLYPNVDVKIILIAEKIPDNLLEYENNLIIFKPLPNIKTSFTSQFIRNLYPCLLDYENGVMITDIDNLPLNKTFFTDNIKNIPNDKWVNLRDWKRGNMICMMWQVATPSTWKQVFDIHSVEDIKETIKSVGLQRQDNWYTDQIYLYKSVMDWNKKTGNYICLKDSDTKFKRLNRRLFNQSIKEFIKKGLYSDFHAPRPYEGIAKKKILEVYDLLP